MKSTLASFNRSLILLRSPLSSKLENNNYLLHQFNAKLAGHSHHNHANFSPLNLFPEVDMRHNLHEQCDETFYPIGKSQ